MHRKYNRLRVDGMDKYIMLVHPWAARDLKDDPKWLAAQQNANLRGSKNPIFTGSLGEYDGVILYEYERVQTGNIGASSANVCQNLLLVNRLHVSQYLDRRNTSNKQTITATSLVTALRSIGAVEKTNFNGKDYGVINVMTGGAVER